MGTLLEQPKRNTHVVDFDDLKGELIEMIKIAKHLKIELKDVLKARECMEMQRANYLRFDNGDIQDEQMSGFGEILKSSLERIASSFEWIAENYEHDASRF